MRRRSPGQRNCEPTAKFTSRVRQASKFLTIPQYDFHERNQAPFHSSPRFGSAGWMVVLSVSTEETTDWEAQLTTSETRRAALRLGRCLHARPH